MGPGNVLQLSPTLNLRVVKRFANWKGRSRKNFRSDISGKTFCKIWVHLVKKINKQINKLILVSKYGNLFHSHDIWPFIHWSNLNVVTDKWFVCVQGFGVFCNNQKGAANTKTWHDKRGLSCTRRWCSGSSFYMENPT